MAETAAHLVDHLIPRVPVRPWAISLAIPQRIVFAAYPQPLSGVLHVIHRVIGGFLVKQAGLKRGAAATGALTLIQRFGSAANLSSSRRRVNRPSRYAFACSQPRANGRLSRYGYLRR